MSDAESDGSSSLSQQRELPVLPVPPPLPRVPVSLGALSETKKPEMFLLPHSGNAVVPIARAYVCDTCRVVRGPEDLSIEIESYFCPACLDALPQTEALACSCRCTKCFDCPRCFATLGVVREPLSAPDAAAAAGAAADESEEAALRAAEALVEKGASPSEGLGPQRCDSLLSISSQEDEGGSDADAAEKASGSGRRASARQTGDGERFEYFFACPYCKWNSRSLGMVSRVSAVLQAAATADERGGRIRRCFTPLFDSLQASAQERERARQLQARVKHKAVALLFAAAAAGGLPGSSGGPFARLQQDKTWRLADVEEMLERRAKQMGETDIWASFRRDIPHAPPRVGLAELLAGKHLSPAREIVSELDWSRKLQQDLLGETARGDAEEDEEDFTPEEAKALEPLSADQVLLDRRTPDVAPVKIPQDVWGRPGKRREDNDAEVMDEAIVGEFPTVEQRIRNPNSLVVPEMSGTLLQPVRKRLLTRQSKRCRTCQKYVVKTQVSPNAVPPLRLNSAAALLLPLMYPRIRDSAVLLGKITDVEIGVVNPAELPMLLKVHVNHGAPEEDPEGDGRHCLSPGAAVYDPGYGSPRGRKGPGGVGDEDAGFMAVRKNWQTLDIFTKDFEVAVDPYDEMLEEFNDEVGELRVDDDPTIVLARKGNSVCLRIRVRPKAWALQHVAACCITVDISIAGDASPIRACYVLCLGRVADQSDADLVRRESL
ncbi:hypothetical protein BESB_078490 [Besnoitia besnoiti]|uniref:Dynactin subunit 4 n=1 Tax=Besnoitia besnoiti TaxID=94643 RepID=A0A2A9MD74_BESBE|nr:hypothetical protein BESB_078490 [Besnoitia besnoiti]PFH33633.1 hypothetical protein BESB_078490 [Besnoitia besnoiti]